MSVRELVAGAADGPLVAFAHGLEDSWESWLPLAQRLRPGCRAVAFDLPWRPGNDYRWRRRPSAAWLGAELDLLERRPDLMVAHSYGANALLEMLCAQDPRLPDRVVLICPLYRPPDVGVTWSVFERARRAFERHIHDSLRSRLGPRLALLDSDVVDLMIAKAVDRIGPSGFLAVFDQFSSSASLALSQIRAQVLVLAGGADPTLSPAAASTLAGGITGARLTVDDDFDHFCYVRRPGEVAATVHAFADSTFVPTPYEKGAAR
ncbi:alpha/beta hydrolase [Micromonospora sp. ATA32]|nr:alpha/beta hydrolase [Micromonospora sp. ATA32]